MHRHFLLAVSCLLVFGVTAFIALPVANAQHPPQNNVDTATHAATPTCTETDTPIPTDTATPTPTETPTPTSSFFPLSYLPFVRKAQEPTPTPTPTLTPTSRPPETLLFCRAPRIDIPDNDPAGLSDVLYISDPRLVLQVSLYVDIHHTWIGDVIVTLQHQDTGKTITAVDRPGVPDQSNGCEYNNMIVIFDDLAAQPAENKCAASPAGVSGVYLPEQPLSVFAGDPITGTWSINVSDNYKADTGSLRQWCIEVTLADTRPEPTPTPTPIELPDSASISGMSGEDQHRPLDCESRSAVDWAAHWDYQIPELQFFANLPESDDPDRGFVGDVWGTWGQVPPDDYGVHAAPIASLLRDYGLEAYAYRSLSYDTLRAEIAAGRPVIVWIIGDADHNIKNGIPEYYTADSTGRTTVVAAYEHTMIILGYTPHSVTALNGEQIKTFSLNHFLDSWSALRFMAVLAIPPP
ncbi:MAG: C39 family peptidase [Anaerolineales bacterium]|nr:C39 family peptidase [Anaerolineales bacterium]